MPSLGRAGPPLTGGFSDVEASPPLGRGVFGSVGHAERSEVGLGPGECRLRDPQIHRFSEVRNSNSMLHRANSASTPQKSGEFRMMFAPRETFRQPLAGPSVDGAGCRPRATAAALEVPRGDLPRDDRPRPSAHEGRYRWRFAGEGVGAAGSGPLEDHGGRARCRPHERRGAIVGGSSAGGPGPSRAGGGSGVVGSGGDRSGARGAAGNRAGVPSGALTANGGRGAARSGAAPCSRAGAVGDAGAARRPVHGAGRAAAWRWSAGRRPARAGGGSAGQGGMRLSRT